MIRNNSKAGTLKVLQQIKSLFFIFLICISTSGLAKTKKKHRTPPRPPVIHLEELHIKELHLEDYTGKFSSMDEEYILADLVKNIPDIVKCYVDIGAGDGISGSNTAKLALNHWQRLALEGDSNKVSKASQIYQRMNNIKIVESKITPLNVCGLLKTYDIPKDFGVLSLDIDSYNYFVLESLLNNFRPSLIIVEINEKIPPPLEFTVLYHPDHSWDNNHFYGQSISQLEKLCSAQNYAIVTLEYNNAFLVAKEKYQGIPLTAREAYEQGYQYRKDRAVKFPWNQDMEILLISKPDDNAKFLNERFAAYRGKYILRNPALVD